MKYLVVLYDGMADYPVPALDGKTPMELANKPLLDKLARFGKVGTVKTVADGLKPGSDIANMSVLGYNPKECYTGRSPLEAVSIGVDMKTTDIALRANIVTVSDDELPYEEKTIIDHSSSEISTEDAAVLIEAVKEAFENDVYKFYVGTSYRHLTIWDKGEVVELTPPHDVLGQTIGQHLPKDEMLRQMMKKSYDILNNHPINVQRAKDGLNKANSLWFWGAGTRPALDSFEETRGLKGVMISAVDLLKGIAVGASMTNIEVEGANGGLHTNYTGKAMAAVKALTEDGYDFAYIHVEAPDEMGHQGSVENKIKAIENLDEKVIKVVAQELKKAGVDFRMLVTPDHPTPIRCRTHTSDAVPYLIYDSTDEKDNSFSYTEKAAKESGNYLEDGYKLIDRLLK